MKLIVFDLGNVVLRYDPEARFRVWSERLGISPEQARDLLRNESAVFDFERGVLAPDEFYKAIDQDAPFVLSHEEFFIGWNSGLGDIVPGMESLLEFLSQAGLRMVALSNTDPAHYETIIRPRFGRALAKFERVFCSHEIGFRKPEPGAYAAVETHTDTAPADIVFLDDLEANIAAARRRGWTGIQVSSFAQSRDELARRLRLDMPT